MIPLDYERAPCPRCGAITVDEAGDICQPSRDETGEAYCPGDNEDDEGYLLQPTAESIARLDAYIGELEAKELGEEGSRNGG